ncbi:MAG: hypothetical protein SGJ10_00215 [Bacteroidota bacterium]|nr:hypothetical protein [Bacteroidota bacterium]
MERDGKMSEEEYILKWSQVNQYWQKTFNKPPDLNSMLFLIGQRETDQPKIKYKKQEKMDFFHVAICKLLSQDGYYEMMGYDDDGWPHYEQLKELPAIDIFTQEKVLKEKIINYFEQENIITYQIII